MCLSTQTLRLDEMAWKFIRGRLVLGCTLNIHSTISYLQCYYINPEQKKSWEEARRSCIELGGNLVSIPTRRVQGLFYCFPINPFYNAYKLTHSSVQHSSSSFLILKVKIFVDNKQILNF